MHVNIPDCSRQVSTATDLGRGVCACSGSSRRRCCGTAVAVRCASSFCLQAAQLLVDGGRAAGLRQLLQPRRDQSRGLGPWSLGGSSFTLLSKNLLSVSSLAVLNNMVSFY